MKINLENKQKQEEKKDSESGYIKIVILFITMHLL